ncbi:MAG: hypothetical protein ACFCU2_05505 [Acidimicrobiia bacterium]
MLSIIGRHPLNSRSFTLPVGDRFWKDNGLVDVIASGAVDLESAVSGLVREVWEGF